MRRESLQQLWQHLRKSHRLWAYVKYLFWRHRQILAYLLLGVVIAFTLGALKVQSDNFNDKLIETGIEARSASCSRDYDLTKGVRNILVVSKSQTDKQYKQGTITTAQYERARNFYVSSLAELPLPDCDAYVAAYKEQIEKARGR